MSKALHSDTLEQQAKLAEYCRTGVEPELVGTTPGRIHHYRRLVFSIAMDALSRTYPLTENLLSDTEWVSLCHRFFNDHACADPQVWRMPFELIEYTRDAHQDLTEKYPHLLELMHFEWLEVEYYMMPDREMPTPMERDFWHIPWALNTEAEIVPLSYPVHRKMALEISAEDEGNYFCLVFRQPESGRVQFVSLSPFFAWLLESMDEQRLSLDALLPTIKEHFGVDDPEVLRKQITPFYQNLSEKGMIL